MKQKSLLLAVFAMCLTMALTATGQDYDDPADAVIVNSSVHQQGPIYNAPFDTYYFNWYPVTTFPATPATYYHHPSAIIGNTLYIQAASGTPTAEIKKYSLGSGNGGGIWEAETPLPTALIGGDLISCNGKLYYLGGDPAAMNSAGSNIVYEFDPGTNQWNTKSPMPVSLTAHGAVNWGDSVIFVMGGPYTTTGSNCSVYYYRVATDTWGTINNSLPNGSSRRTFGIGISGNKIMIAGGYNGSFLKTAYVGTINSISSITWSQVSDIPTSYGGLSRMGGEAAGGYFFTAGGERLGGGYHDTTYVFKFASNSWLPLYIPKPTAVSNVFNAVCAKTYTNDTIRVFVPSGYVGSGLNNTNFEVMRFRAATGVGIVSLDQEKIVEIFPNPSYGNFNLKINNAPEPLSGEILDISGRVLQALNLHQGNNNIDLQGVPDGLYFVRVSTPGGLITCKLHLLD